jgi:hypothetical protein
MNGVRCAILKANKIFNYSVMKTKQFGQVVALLVGMLAIVGLASGVLFM